MHIMFKNKKNQAGCLELTNTNTYWYFTLTTTAFCSPLLRHFSTVIYRKDDWEKDSLLTSRGAIVRIRIDIQTNVLIFREFVRRVSSPKLLESNPKFKLSTEVKSDQSEPYIKITYSRKLFFLFPHLTRIGMAEGL